MVTSVAPAAIIVIVMVREGDTRGNNQRPCWDVELCRATLRLSAHDLREHNNSYTYIPKNLHQYLYAVSLETLIITYKIKTSYSPDWFSTSSFTNLACLWIFLTSTTNSNTENLIESLTLTVIKQWHRWETTPVVWHHQVTRCNLQQRRADRANIQHNNIYLTVVVVCDTKPWNIKTIKLLNKLQKYQCKLTISNWPRNLHADTMQIYL